MGQLSQERMNRVREASYKYFDWKTVLAEAGVTEIQDLSDQLLLKCPMHEDWKPSFRVRLNEHDCHCFSCGFWGRVIDLMYELSGKQVSKSQFYDQVLKRTPGMQVELGFASVYLDAYTLDPALKGRRRFDPKSHIGSEMPVSVFSKKVRALGDTWENLVFSLTLMQEGESTDNIYSLQSKTASLSKETSGVTEISLMSLLDD